MSGRRRRWRWARGSVSHRDGYLSVGVVESCCRLSDDEGRPGILKSGVENSGQSGFNYYSSDEIFAAASRIQVRLPAAGQSEAN